jgi:hypothetical protein
MLIANETALLLLARSLQLFQLRFFSTFLLILLLQVKEFYLTIEE